MKRILCVPLDPVHDVGIKIIRRKLADRGHHTELLPPDLPMEEVVRLAATQPYDFILVSRTLGYGVAELLSRFNDLLDAAGVRDTAKIVLGGKPITPELAAELGFDHGFGEHSSLEEIFAYIEERPVTVAAGDTRGPKPSITAPYSYEFRHARIGALLETIADRTLAWAEHKSSPGVQRARLRERILAEPDGGGRARLTAEYHTLCEPVIADGNRDGRFPKGVRRITDTELTRLRGLLDAKRPLHPSRIRHTGERPLLFKFLGSGCPTMDLLHGKVCERYGIDGFLIINPSWEARYEGLLHGLLTHENDGTITSLENIRLLRELLHPSTLLTVRGHRGLNTPETVLLAAHAGADLTKINLVYGSLGAGTDPERLTVDGLEAMRIAGRHGMGFDIPGNDELSGVPAYKSLAGQLINVMLGKRLGAKAILKPLFCYGPHIVLNGQMERNYVDYNAAKVRALRAVADVPVWPGEPIAFMTQTEERVQSANATSYHAALAASAGVDAITIASTDEAFSRGPITIASRIDSIRAVTDAYRFMGDASFAPTAQADRFTEEMVRDIERTLEAVAAQPSLPHAINAGLLGSREDGAYPGTFGKGSVTA
ncbi:MAG: cobalamin B12-binding domain-containing protein [Bacteroidetes bacterium]|nr:MAG: cobalamin B12-binding domain-containing protein [Bacteroidota bacterium]